MIKRNYLIWQHVPLVVLDRISVIRGLLTAIFHQVPRLCHRLKDDIRDFYCFEMIYFVFRGLYHVQEKLL